MNSPAENGRAVSYSGVFAGGGGRVTESGSGPGFLREAEDPAVNRFQITQAFKKSVQQSAQPVFKQEGIRVEHRGAVHQAVQQHGVPGVARVELRMPA